MTSSKENTAFQIVLKRRAHIIPIAFVRVKSIHPFVAGYRILIILFSVQHTLQKPSQRFGLPSGQVEAVEVHDLVPHRYKVVQELLLRVLTSVDFRQGPELGVRTEDKVDPSGGPLELAALAITTFEHLFVL
jgi:hypothetical protein